MRARSAPPDLGARLDAGLSQLGLSPDATTRQRLLDYLGLLAKWNAVYNLTALREPELMLVQHLLDALALVPVLRRHLDPDGTTVADVGSGAGVPGLVLAIVESGIHLLSIEPVGKKAAFQRQVCAELGLTRVEVIARRAESVSRPVDAVVCRAFTSLRDFVAVTAGLGGPETLRFAMKGRREEIDTELRALPAGCSASVEPITVPFLDAQRHVVILRCPAQVA